jgi:hypothetical protein
LQHIGQARQRCAVDCFEDILAGHYLASIARNAASAAPRLPKARGKR